jgi:hypothetical protein
MFRNVTPYSSLEVYKGFEWISASVSMAVEDEASEKLECTSRSELAAYFGLFLASYTLPP